MKKRLFVAHMVKIGGISEIKERVNGFKVLGKWVESENLHFTYRFIGDFEVERIEDLKFELRERLKDIKAPEVKYKGLGVFPNFSSPRVLWIGVHSTSVGDVKKGVDLALKKFGFGAEERAFKPHVTLMRIKRLRHAIKFKSFLFSMKEKVFHEDTAYTVSLVESKLTEKGPLYREILKVELGR